MRRLPRIEPGQVWFVDFDPVRGRGQGKDRPALVSSRFHLDLTMGQWIWVLPLTSVERVGWLHRVNVGTGGGWVIAEQIRTVSVERFRRHAADIQLSATELSDVRHVLAQMLIV
ncbi:type II toxin-antitoxin system PemK/MazF family toxin [Mycobacterium sp. THU-M104]|uniref:type II toxin-antitoxin system PemK/MazF family toxin n=1 Tax=Mycobacterium sp. THU-M104 TaxID=3410515 RepID=UPI003B9D5D1A